MTDWRAPCEEGGEDTGELWVRMGRLERRAERIVDDVEGDAGFGLLALVVRWMAVLQGRILRAERWARRAARKREMLAGEGLRGEMCERLGGVGALERWERRAKLALLYSRQADGSRLRGNDEGGGLGDGRPKPSAHLSPSSPRRRGSPSGVREFALARMPGRGVRRVRTRIRRAAPKHETPIPVWPCEVMPERFRREWWRAEPAKAKTKDSRFPEGAAGGGYTVSPSGENDRADDGGPGSSPGTCVAPPIAC